VRRSSPAGFGVDDAPDANDDNNALRRLASPRGDHALVGRHGACIANALLDRSSSTQFDRLFVERVNLRIPTHVRGTTGKRGKLKRRSELVVVKQQRFAFLEEAILR
jgi:hypothetical protein